MATYQLLGTSPISFIAGGSITKDTLVKMDTTAGQVVVTTAITDMAIGAALKTVSSGEIVPVQIFGVAKLTAKAAITTNVEVMPDGAGGGKVAASSGATARSIGVALEAAGADGDVISVLLTMCPKGPANS